MRGRSLGLSTMPELSASAQVSTDSNMRSRAPQVEACLIASSTSVCTLTSPSQSLAISFTVARRLPPTSTRSDTGTKGICAPLL